MNSWPGTVVVGLVILVIFLAGANSQGDETDDGAGPVAASGPSTTPSATPEPATTTDADGNAAPIPAGAGSQETRGVALTFDDGPHPEYTPQVLDILADHDVRAVFCLVGAQVKAHPELVRRIVDEGHALCNHTFDHDGRLAERSEAEIIDDLARTEEAIKAAAPDAVVSYFRQPMMFVTENVARVARSFAYRPLNWSIDTRDWERPGPRKIVAAVSDNLQAGSVVIMHDGGGKRQDTVDALPDVIDAIDDGGLPIVLPQRPITAELLGSHLKSLW